MDKEKTGMLIKEARISKGYTQSELADILGVTNKAVSHWEKGESYPDVGLLESLSSCLGISIEELVVGEPADNDEFTMKDFKRLLRSKRKEAIKKIIPLFANAIIMIIILGRFYFAFLSGKGYSWSYVNDILLLIVCYLIMFFINYRGQKSQISFQGKSSTARTILALSLLSLSIIIMIFFVGVCDIILELIPAEYVGPILSFILGVIAVISAGLFEYIWFISKNKCNEPASFINTGTIFLCISYREWLGSLLSIEAALRSLWIITIAIVLMIIVSGVIASLLQLNRAS
ncbi:helix-turn-helix domain-containing protein [Pseudobutyrivibrio sp.]